VWEKLENLQSPQTSTQTLHTGKLVPVYPETMGLTSKWFRTKIAQVLPLVSSKLQDPLPEFIQDTMISLTDALQKIHQPKDYKEVERAKERLSFDELFYVSLATLKARKEWSKKPLVAPLTIYSDALEEFTGKLPFTLTNAQKRVIEEVIGDLKKNQPMNRLIQGEVGSGKTVVTAIIIYLVYLNHYKTLFMAPTEILAFQHYSTISNLLEPLGIKVGIYTGSKKSKDIIADVMIGTHALLFEKLIPKDVGLVVIDEQQRFGVEQRTLLRSKAKLPHFLTTTATPIPRTVALVLYGDLDLSTIDELPKNRQQIKTYVVPNRKRNDAYKFIEKKIKEGDQAYLITPLIEESETLQSAKAAKVEFAKLKKVFPKLKLGLLHGRLKGKEKEEVMQKFKDRSIDLLVSTSVVEVGMDVTNATIMVIESAERFGLAQLHQLRGRVGRGPKQSYCLLFMGAEDSNSKSRLKNLEKINDGMKLAELDLKIRGSGEIFGIRQSGRFEFKLASFSDIHLVEKTRQAAQDVLKIDPALDKYPTLKGKLDDLTKGAMPD
ncbi:ATP-dependent DNA helicase RecG, partial [Candidatus Daviesbacteria bacterium]|nr:ATP-dependent DNA helicase RecG [Candidatus Daviesbacteria bacterium]